VTSAVPSRLVARSSSARDQRCALSSCCPLFVCSLLPALCLLVVRSCAHLISVAARLRRSSSPSQLISVILREKGFGERGRREIECTVRREGPLVVANSAGPVSPRTRSLGSASRRVPYCKPVELRTSAVCHHCGACPTHHTHTRGGERGDPDDAPSLGAIERDIA